MIASLAQLSSLRVISRTSAMRYRESTKTLPEIARELNVEAVLGKGFRPGNDLSSLENNLSVVRILEAARTSAKEGKRVVL